MSQACPYCGNLDFEEENGVLVCTSCGRQQEGGLQVADDDADFGTQGKIARRKVEKTKVKVTKIYRGPRAYKLYLQAWQHIMWRQTYALIHGSMKAPPELWTVVRDLWTVRLSTLLSRLENKALEDSAGDLISNTDHDTSSASEPEHTQKRTKHSLSPTIWDTISFVHLAALLIRMPICLSTLYDLIRSEDIPFIRAIRFVPYEMTSHLPSEYQLALDTTTIPQRQGLQRATFNFLRSFNTDLGMQIPALNWRILLYEWIIKLGLPLEIYDTVKDLAKLLDYNFTYQFGASTKADPDSEPKVRKPRRTPVAMPELQLMSLIIVATKLLFPFPINNLNPAKEIAQHATATSSLSELSLDWTIWLSIHKSHTTSDSPNSKAAKHLDTTDRDVANMSPEDIDSYIEWYQQTFSTPDSILRQKKTDLEMSILDMFPLPEKSLGNSSNIPQQQETPRHSRPQSHSEPHSSSSSSSDSHIKTPNASTAQAICTEIQRTALRYTPNTPHQPYLIFTSLEALTSPSSSSSSSNRPTSNADEEQTGPGSNTAHNHNHNNPDEEGNQENNPTLYFHNLAAALACTDLKSLFRAVRYTEGKMEGWIRDRRREEVFGGVRE